MATPFPVRRWLTIGLSVMVGLAILALAAIAVFPWGSLRSVIEARLSARFRRPVTIERIDRVDTVGFHPVIAIRGVRIPQPGWVGRGDFVQVARVQANFSALALLTGRFAPRDVAISGLRLALVRDATGRTNWKRAGEDKKADDRRDALPALTIADSMISYDDAKQDRRVVARIASDARTGVQLRGRGMVRGAAITLRVAGPPVERTRGKPWPFTATIDGPRLAMTARGTMDRALDTRAMTLDVTARAADLKLIDAVIEAGLFETRPVALSAHVRRADSTWTITNLAGRIGRSDLSGKLTVAKHDGRSRIDGAITSRQLDFDDLSSEQGRTRAQALETRIGPRLVPNTRVDIGKITRTDGVLRFGVGRIVSREGPSSVTALSGVATMDHQLLTITPLTLRLPKGIVHGSLVIDQRGGRPEPIVTIDVALTGSSVGALAGGHGDYTGDVSARARLRGTGETIRAAVARADGRVGFVVRDGTLPDQIAAALGFDAGRALLAGHDDRAGLRCVILRLAVRGGQGRVDPLLLDTTQSQMRGEGWIRFPDETLDLRLTGAPKRNALLRLPGAAFMTGTISHPQVTVPPEVKSVGNILKAIGRAIKGTQGPTATDADCAGLAAQALR